MDRRAYNFSDLFRLADVKYQKSVVSQVEDIDLNDVDDSESSDDEVIDLKVNIEEGEMLSDSESSSSDGDSDSSEGAEPMEESKEAVLALDPKACMLDYSGDNMQIVV